MLQYNWSRFLLLIVPVLFGSCSGENHPSLSISFSSDSTAIVFKGIDPAGLNKLKNDRLPDSVLKNLIAVLQTPSESDTTIREMPVSGQFRQTDSSIVFNPDIQFVRGRDYLVITHLNTNFVDTKKILTNDISLSIKPVQQLLSR